MTVVEVATIIVRLLLRERRHLLRERRYLLTRALIAEHRARYGRIG